MAEYNALTGYLMPEGSDPYYGQKFMPSQVATAYHPTLRDRVATWLLGDQRRSPDVNALVEGLTGSRGMGTTGMGLLDVTPAGVPFAVQDAYRSGDDRQLAMALMPGPAKGVTQEAKAGIRAYHGSPHDFDHFDMSKIGTGEGAQAYGHGLYFAEAEDVAKQYRKNLSPKNNSEAAAQELAESNGRSWGDMGAYERQSYIDEAQRQNLQPSRPVNGRLYEVRINADPNDFLDWDKPLSAQSEKVRGALDKAAGSVSVPIDMVDGVLRQKFYEPMGQLLAGVDDMPVLRQSQFHRMPFNDQFDAVSLLRERKGEAAARQASELIAAYKEYTANPRKSLSVPEYDQFTGGRTTGGDLVGILANKTGIDHRGDFQPETLASTLRDAGIPGIKYLDQGSRSAGEGSRNYVVFRDDIIDIVKKYGIAAAASMYGLEAVNNAMGQAQQPQNALTQSF